MLSSVQSYRHFIQRMENRKRKAEETYIKNFDKPLIHSTEHLPGDEEAEDALRSPGFNDVFLRVKKLQNRRHLPASWSVWLGSGRYVHAYISTAEPDGSFVIRYQTDIRK
jgi:hypothetical protein